MISEVLEISTTIVAAIGGIGFIFWGLSGYIGKLWADKYLETIRRDNERELQQVRSELKLLRDTQLRYSGKQFELYQTLYLSLLELRDSADILWSKPTNIQFDRFSIQLTRTKQEVEKSYLFLEKSHYEKLVEILKNIDEYKNGTEFNLKGITGEIPTFEEADFNNSINHCKKYHEKYSDLVEEIRESIRVQLRGKI